MLNVAGLLVRNGLKLTQADAYLLCLAICVHDLGMVVSLKDTQEREVFLGMPQSPDPANTENFIRENHHELVEQYVSAHFGFLSGVGVTPPDIGLVKQIARCHRRVELREQEGSVKALGALLRVIDELDISPDRAPANVLREHYEEMGATAAWHWFKHNISEPWREKHNVIRIVEGSTERIEFRLIVHPPAMSSQQYWLNQIRRPITKALLDEGANQVIRERWGVQIKIEPAHQLSTPNDLGSDWAKIEKMALSAGRKVVLVIDDESRKMTDLFMSLMDKYHVVFAEDAKDALATMAVSPADLVIVDMQVGSGQLWTAAETQDFKATGLKLIQEIRDRYPGTRLGVLTGTRHDIGTPPTGLAFFYRKPVDPQILEEAVINVLG
jgi:CheY-like chemotaxis protein